jgi:molecular chaperone DnaJ
VKKVKEVSIKVPKGVDNGQYLKINRQGELGDSSGPPGDLYIALKIKEHEIFDRHETDLLCKTTIDLGTAVFGGEIEVPTIDGNARLAIPAGTQSHTVFRLKGHGMPHVNSTKRGDQLVKIVVKIPAKKEAVFPEKRTETGKGFFEDMKEL